jgi:TonB-dependent SusC/RagA subfamily outer membrane receptor
MNKKQFFILIISILFTLPIGIKAQNQKIKIPGNSISLKAAFDQIEKQTGLSVDYDAKTIDVKKLISISSQSIALKDLMTLLLNDTQCNYIINKSHIIISYSSENPKGNNSGNMDVSKKITGLVTDEKGEPIIGASVVLKGSNTGTITNIDGLFSLEVSEQSEITISYIGYKQTTIKIDKSNNYKIVLEDDSKTLDEVVVIGYGTKKKRDVIGSVATVKTEELNKSASLSAINNLQGKASGLNISNSAAGYKVMVRGVHSINSGNDPLWVVDGIPSSPPNSEEIESIEILKDASATAIYGSRGSNGVIIVTTKRGKEGRTELDMNVHS